jgi:quercetin dioxygenase-like cupin family protein
MAAGLAFWIAAEAATPPTPPPGRTLLQTTTDVQRIELGDVRLVKDVAGGRHTHDGIETGVVIEGSFALEIDGQASLVLTEGQSFLVPRGVVHRARGLGPNGARLICTWVVDSAAPTARPVS